LLLRYNLEAEGYRVETVPRGDEADLLLKERTPDLVMPGQPQESMGGDHTLLARDVVYGWCFRRRANRHHKPRSALPCT
jgi:hypothetical protein